MLWPNQSPHMEGYIWTPEKLIVGRGQPLIGLLLAGTVALLTECSRLSFASRWRMFEVTERDSSLRKGFLGKVAFSRRFAKGIYVRGDFCL